MATKITRDIIESYLNCKLKGHLKRAGESGTRSDYEAMTVAARQASREQAIIRLVSRFGEGDACRGIAVSAATLTRGAPLLADAGIEDGELSLCFDGLKRVDGPSLVGQHHYLPVLHNHGDKGGRQQKILLAVFGLALARVQGLRPGFGLIARGPEGRLGKIRLDAKLYRLAVQLMDELKRLLAGNELRELVGRGGAGVRRLPGPAGRSRGLRPVPLRQLREDGAALRNVTEFVQGIAEAARSRGTATAAPASGPSVAWADQVGMAPTHRLVGGARLNLADLDHINRCAYFDYQREKVFFRTNKAVKRACLLQRRRRPRPRATRDIEIGADVCPCCGGGQVAQLGEKTCSKVAYDLKFTRGGIRRQVIRCKAAWHRCEDCQERFSPEGRRRRDKHLHGLKSWAMYQHVVHRVNFCRLEGMLEDCFGLCIDRAELQGTRALMANRYRKTCDQILRRIVGGPVGPRR